MGFATRMTFEDFAGRYKTLGPASAATKKEQGIKLLQYIPKHFPNTQGKWQQGVTKVFLKADMVFCLINFR